jgi:hypothetical protein
MTLQEFVSQSLLEIVTGIRESQKEAYKYLADINPPVSRNEMQNTPRSDIAGAHGQVDVSPHTTFVEFDVAVLATTDSKTKAGLGLFVASFGAGATTEAGDVKNTHNRIKFTIPIRLRSASEYMEELRKVPTT